MPRGVYKRSESQLNNMKLAALKLRKLNVINCSWCKKTFHPRRKTTKFCSSECSLKHLYENNVAFWRQNINKIRKEHTTQKIPDEKMLNLWQEYKLANGSISLLEIFRRYDYKAIPFKLFKLVGEEEYKTTMNKNTRMCSRYIKGRRIERAIINELLKEGYYCIRSAGSKGIWDIIAIPLKGGKIRLIQSKSNKSPSKEEMELMRSFPVSDMYIKELWITKDFKPAVKTIIP